MQLPLADLAHLYRRAAFGPRPSDLTARRTRQEAVDALFAASASVTPLPLAAADFALPANAEKLVRKRDLSEADKKMLRRRQRNMAHQLNAAWFDRLTTGEGQLRERLTLFWHGHFATRARRPDFAWRQNETFRRLALGKFGDLLTALLYDPALQTFLSNDRNRREHPNENFARELLELFTLGRGNYSEQDIREGARAFTGWQFDRLTGEFRFNERQHDLGPKTFLGQTGAWRGEDVVRIVLQHPQTALFITRKLYCYLVSDAPDDVRVATLAADFRQSDYDVGQLVRQILLADWFYADPAVRQHRLKSPIELLTGLRRLLAVDLPDARGWLLLQKALGQELFQPPNVAGWPGGRAWIDSSTLVYRLRLPQLLTRRGHHLDVAVKDDDDSAPNMGQANERLSLESAGADFAALRPLAGPGATPDLAKLAEVLLAVPLRADLRRALEAQTPAFDQLALALLSLPEYQLG